MCARVLTEYEKIAVGALDLFFMGYRRNKLIKSPMLGQWPGCLYDYRCSCGMSFSGRGTLCFHSPRLPGRANRKLKLMRSLHFKMLAEFLPILCQLTKLCWQSCPTDGVVCAELCHVIVSLCRI